MDTASPGPGQLLMRVISTTPGANNALAMPAGSGRKISNNLCAVSLHRVCQDDFGDHLVDSSPVTAVVNKVVFASIPELAIRRDELLVFQNTAKIAYTFGDPFSSVSSSLSRVAGWLLSAGALPDGPGSLELSDSAVDADRQALEHLAARGYVALVSSPPSASQWRLTEAGRQSLRPFAGVRSMGNPYVAITDAPVESLTKYALINLLLEGGWDWRTWVKKRTGSERPAPFLTDGSSPKVFYSRGRIVGDKYMQALLLADTLRDKHSIAEIPHGCAEATYVELLAGRPIQDVGERAALTLDCEDGLMMLGDGGAASDELPAKRARREPPDPEGRGGARRQAAAATLDEWEGGLGLTSPEPESEAEGSKSAQSPKAPSPPGTPESSPAPSPPGTPESSPGAKSDSDDPPEDPDDRGPRGRVLHAGSHYWGPFWFSYLPNSASGPEGWQVTCPFHARSAVTGCKKELRIRREGETLESLLIMLRYWCSLAPDFTRQYFHVPGCGDLRAAPIPHRAVFDNEETVRRLTEAAPEEAPQDDVLDGLADAGGRGRGRAGRGGRRGRGAQGRFTSSTSTLLSVIRLHPPPSAPLPRQLSAFRLPYSPLSFSSDLSDPYLLPSSFLPPPSAMGACLYKYIYI